MKKACVRPGLALLTAALVAGTAAAQDAPGRAVAGDGSYAFDRFGNRNFQLRSDIGDGVGYEKGYQTFGIFQPIILEPDQSLFFVNPRGFVTYQGNFAGNLGAGFRYMDPNTERILGASGWFDHDGTGNFDYDQWGISLESLGNIWDFRANAYLPTNSNANAVYQQLTGSIFFVGNNIGLGRQSQFQSQLGGGDFEVGGAVIPGFSDAGFRAYAGGYYMQGDMVGAAYGVKARIEALVTQDFWLNVGYSNDDFFDSNLTMAVTWYLGTGNEPQWFQRMPQNLRLYQQVERNYRNMVLTHEVVDFVDALRAGGTGGSGGPVGTPIFVVHVDNTATAPGDGTVENPYSELPNSTAGNVDIVFIHRGDGTTTNMNGGIVLNDWQRLLGQGLQHTFTATQGTFLLPGFVPGPFPSITNLGGDAVTLASHNEVAGLNIPDAGNSGVFGNAIEDFNLHHLNITDSGLEGIFLANTTGTGRINDVTVDGAGTDGIAITNTGTSVLNLISRDNTVTNSADSGLRLSTTDTAAVILASTRDTFDDNGLDGINLNAAGGSTITSTFTDTSAQNNFRDGLRLGTTDTASAVLTSTRGTFESNGVDGVNLVATGGSTLRSTLIDVSARTNGRDGVNIFASDSAEIATTIRTSFFGSSSVSSNQRDGVHLFIHDNAIGSLTVLDSDVLGNARDGIRTELDDNAILDLFVDGNNISGGSVGLTFFIDGNTFGQPYSITNDSPAGGPLLADFTLNLNSALEFDTSGFSGLPFAPVGGTEVTTGLLTVNGTTNPPGWVVADNSQSLDMTFNNFDPTETFSWDIDVDFAGNPQSTVLGSDLIGSTVTATFADGQILAGSLVAVSGQPEAATFVASSGLGGGTNVHMITAGNSQLRSATISNNTIANAGEHGISLEMSGNSIVGTGGVLIQSNTIDGNGAAATSNGINVVLTDAADIASGRLEIDLNTITNNSGNGIGLSAADTSLLNALVTGNTITDNTLAGINVAGLPNAAVGVEISGQNVIQNNGGAGIAFDMLDSTTAAVIQNNVIESNGGIGIDVVATNGTFALTVGGPGDTDGNILDSNTGAGIAFTLQDTATGILLIQNNEITNTVAAAGDPIFTGQAIDIRLTDSGIAATATASLLASSILDNTLGSEISAADGNAGAGLQIFADNATTINGLLVDGNIMSNNGGDGVNFNRRDSAVIDDVVFSNNSVQSNTLSGFDITAANDANDLINISLTNNDILNNTIDGVFAHLEADAQLSLTLTGNLISGQGVDGIHVDEQINDSADRRFITGSWTNNEISNNGNVGILLDGATNGLSIGSAGGGNLIVDNGAEAILITAPGNGTINSNTIDGNGSTAIDIEMTTSTPYFNNAWTISFNTITNNSGDGIEILNNQPLAGFVPGLAVTIDHNTIRGNTGRGIDVLNRIGVFSRADMAVTIQSNVISENDLEGIYVVNTASTTQVQNAPATTPLAADGSIFTRPRLDLIVDDNTLIGNGVNSGFNTTGLVVRVGTSDGGYGFTNPGGFYAGGRGGVGATVTNNRFGGNFGNDIYYESFTSTVAPGTTAGTWDATTFDVTFYEGDPLARLDLIQTGNTFDSTQVNNVGAFYNDGDAVFKSRDIAQADPGPFLDGARQRNAQRLGFRDGLPPGTPGGLSDLFLYAGMGESTFRIQTGFDAAAGFFIDNAPYNSIFDANGVINGFPFGEFMPYGWTEF